MKEAKSRMPVVAGQFYPASAQGIRKQIESFLDKSAKKTDVIACMLPHAGYMYSGRVAVETVSRINIKDKVILLGPNHTGFGSAFSIMTEGIWETPLGAVKIDSELAAKLLKNSKHLESDTLAHADEHSLEVELPILQYFRPDFEIVPIAFMTDDVEALKKTGAEIAGVLKEQQIKDSVMMVASSDMTHYESSESARQKDNEAIEAIINLDADRLVQRIRQLNISMCGYAPVIAMITAAKILGATAAKLVKYQTSGDVTGDNDSVVGYAGMIIY